MRSMFSKIVFRVLFIFILLAVSLGGISYFFIKEMATNNIINKGKTIALTIADAVEMDLAKKDLGNFQYKLNQYLNIPTIKYIVITDEKNNIISDTFTPEVPAEIKESLTPDMQTFPYIEAIQVQAEVLYGTLGHVYVGMDTSHITYQLIELLPKLLLPMPVALILCLLLLYLVTRKITKPIQKLTTFTQELEQHQFNTTKINLESLNKIKKQKNEIGRFTTSYMDLCHELETHIEKLIQAAEKKTGLEKETALAHEIQMSMLNKEPKTANYPNMSFSAYTKPAKNVGGDFYEVFEKHNKVYIAFGDVSGEGLDAARWVAVTLTSIRTSLTYLSAPSDIVTTINQQMSLNNPETVFVSLFFASIDPTTGVMEHINAGHPRPLLIESNISVIKTIKNPVIGINKHHFYRSSQALLPSDAILCLVSNGVTNTQNNTNDYFGVNAIKDALSNLKTPSAHDTTAKLQDALNRFSPNADARDDQTILSCKFVSKNKEVPNPLVISFKNDINELIKIQQATTIFANQYSIEDRIQKSINLVLEELLANTIYYGYNDNQEQPIYLKLTHNQKQIIIDIEDNATPFNPITDAPEPALDANINDREIGGLGINIVKKMVNHIDYKRQNDKNVVTIIKDLE